jgi:hypothetical protein
MQRIASSVFNAEHAINEVNARLEALTLQMASQTQIETTTCTTLSFHLMPLGITLKQTSSRKQRTLHVTKPKRTVRIGSVRLPKWFLQRQYDLQLLYATSGWPLFLSACSIVPHDSPFFEACRTGDVETMKLLLSSKQASVYDRDPSGSTAFQFGLITRQLEVCKFLRHAGIFAQFDYEEYQKILRNLEWALNDFTEQNLSLLRVSAPINEPDRDWFKEYDQFTTKDGRVVVHHNSELLSMLNNLQSDTSMLNVLNLRKYFEFRIRSPQWVGAHSFMSYIVRTLSNTSTIREITAAPDEFTWIVYALAREIALTAMKYVIPSEQWPRRVRQALCAVVRVGLNPHQTSGRLKSPWNADKWYQDLSMTPLGLLCIEAMRIRVYDRREIDTRRDKDLRKRLQAWISGLHYAGIDLLQYAKAESVCYGCTPDLLAIPWKTGARIAVATGPRPEDWRFSLWEPWEPYARQFWSLVEEDPVVPRLTVRILEAFLLPTSQNPTSPDLPGSWPSEEARITEELESWLLQWTDDALAGFEEDLSLLSESDFLAK